MDKQEAVKRCYQIPGMCWPVELGVLFDLFAGSLEHVEIGSFCGRSLFVTAMTLGEGAKLTIVEPLIGCHSDEYPLPNQHWQKQVLKATLQAIREHRPDLSLEWLQTLSIDALRGYTGNPQSVYVDGCHYFAEVLADIQGWYSILQSPGLLAGHDYWSRDPGVVEAVNESKIPFSVIPGTRIFEMRK